MMDRGMVLGELKPGERAVVTGVDFKGGMRRRLQDIGLIVGTEVTCISRSPLGDPTAYRIKKAVIALRSEDSGIVKVCLLEGEENSEKKF